VERSSRYVVLLRLPHGRSAEDVRAALTRHVSKPVPIQNAVARQLNNRPRQTLNWMKPFEVFARAVASIA
jgi:IS30 family transposase